MAEIPEMTGVTEVPGPRSPTQPLHCPRPIFRQRSRDHGPAGPLRGQYSYLIPYRVCRLGLGYKVGKRHHISDGGISMAPSKCNLDGPSKVNLRLVRLGKAIPIMNPRLLLENLYLRRRIERMRELGSRRQLDSRCVYERRATCSQRTAFPLYPAF
jgi:hypothetical protein